ncbi:hypothetical protein RBSWK_06140 [Rhodopirellula baltica SWK14]|uniref:Uncharacterized protein n=1 Tax=Rhodopirellula baltica SWK14 TaxID=993516 RepID=L7C8S3_RHOBT|nr:hypothetical protein RBSWK_06140 [Rhodopirellula baltica SWK14]
MILAGVLMTNHTRNIHHHLVNVVTVRVPRMSVVHATTQQCMKHYGGHRREGEELVIHGRFEDVLTFGTTRRIVAVLLSNFGRRVYSETV